MSPRHIRRDAGFTLLELLITIAVIGILAGVAYPSFQNQLRKSRRSEAMTALAQLQQAQERFRSGQLEYADNVTAGPGDDPPGLGLQSITPSGYYDIAIPAQGPGGYIATATARSGTSQAADTGCTLLVVSLAQGEVTTGSASTAMPLTDANRCWAK